MTQHPGAPLDPEEQVELGKEVTIRRERPSGPVIAIRIPRDVVAKLSAYASTRNMTVSEVVREAAIRFVAESTTSGPFYVTGAQVEGPNIVTGGQGARGGRVLNREYQGQLITAAISRRP